MAVSMSGLTVEGRIKARPDRLRVYTTYLATPIWSNTQATFSNGNLTALHAGNGRIRSAASVSTGLRYWEITLTTWSSQYAPIVGIAKASTTSGPDTYTYNTDLFCWWGGGGAFSSRLYGVNDGTSYGSGMSGGNKIGVLLDNANHTLTFYKNGVSQGVAYTSLPAVEYVAWVQSAAGSSTVNETANFGATDFTYPIAGAEGIYTLV